VTVSVSATDVPTWYGHGHERVLVVSGELTGADFSALSTLVARAEDTGVTRVVLDVGAVRSCDRDGLLALVASRGRRSGRRTCVVDVVGVRRAQFLDAIAREPRMGVHQLEAAIDELRRPLIVAPLPRTPLPPS
jgi:hypothetical protein